MEHYQLPELPLWLEESPHPVTWFQKWRAKHWDEVLIFKAKLFGCKDYGNVYLVYSYEKKRFFVDLEHGYFPNPRFHEPESK